MQNVEFKSELRDLPLARSICASFGAIHAETLRQSDTYFRLADGRLKKRENIVEPGPGARAGVPEAGTLAVEYIFYHRPNASGPRVSRFKIYTPSEARRFFGAGEPPVWVVVRKTREVHLIQNVRIHLDSVEGLGTFMEFEALVSPRNTVDKCLAAPADLRRAFGPVLGEPVSHSYSDLLAAEAEDTQPAGGTPG